VDVVVAVVVDGPLVEGRARFRGGIFFCGYGVRYSRLLEKIYSIEDGQCTAGGLWCRACEEGELFRAGEKVWRSSAVRPRC
jgi:hypothetical protein